ncbi:MAG: PAS domain-containing sensor histidine kinase [Bacteroidetes bacterium]|nr:MAG: PAS domain-containing sensor histidine kinase [Bacteroidota bacterium]
MSSRLSRKFENSGAIFSAIVETAIDAIVIIDSAGVVQTVNPSALEMFGYEEQELLGQPVNMLMPEFHASRHDSYIKNYVDSGHAKIIGIGREVQGLRKNGTLFPTRLAVSEVFTDGQRYFAGFLHDLTDIKEAQAAILKLNEELEEMVVARTEELSKAVNTLLNINKKLEREIMEREAIERELIKSREDLEESLEKEKDLNELKSRFVSMASHEFRTPLSTILSSAALIARYPDTDQQPKRDRHINRIKSAVNGLNGILNDFLSLSKIEEGRIFVNNQPHNIDAICREVMDDIEGLLKSGQMLKHQTQTGEISIQTDKNILKNILFNLTSNAIKYSGEDTEILCSTSVDDDVLTIEIADQGMGIPKREQKHLFSRFFRASNASNIEGTGLGLNIVAGYVEMLNGSIDYKSVEEEGTTFILRLPIGKEDNGQDISN